MDRQKKELMAAPPRPPIRPSASESDNDERPLRLAALETEEDAKCVKIVEFRSGEAVIRHPDLKDMVCEGWEISSAVPHVGEADDVVQLLVVMTRITMQRDEVTID